MESLPADIKRKIALELTPSEIVVFCRAESQINKEICESDSFWRSKLQRDYPDLFYYHDRYGVPLRHPKNTYMRTFSKFFQEIENFSKKFHVNTNAVNELYKEYRLKDEDESILEDFKKKYSVPKTQIGNLFLKLKQIEGYYLRYGAARR